MIILTNGSSGIEALRKAGVTDEIFSWDDVLHDGPVRDLPMANLVQERSKYLAQHLPHSTESIARRFLERNSYLEKRSTSDPLVLVFEHDLYDQLQLIQILHYCHELGRTDRVWLAQCDDFIGEISSEKLLAFRDSKVEVTERELFEARDFWKAFTRDSPIDLNRFNKASFTSLSCMWGALSRLKALYPSLNTGLTKTEEIVLKIISEQEGISSGKIFTTYLDADAPKFMGDGSFALRLDRMLNADKPLLKFHLEQDTKVNPDSKQMYWRKKLILTDYGKDVLAGDERYEPKRDYWIGGTWLNSEKDYVFDQEKNELAQRNRR